MIGRRRELLLVLLLVVALLLEVLSTSLSANFRLVVQTQRDAIDSCVECAHDGHSSPKVADLEETVEDAVLHVLHVTLVAGHRPVPDEVLPADD